MTFIADSFLHGINTEQLEWLKEKYEARHGFRPDLADLIADSLECERLGTHAFDYCTIYCIRCGTPAVVEETIHADA
jgi:hypothetical protein